MELIRCFYAFVILTYRNSEDIEQCILSINEHFDDSKIVVVNSFYDTLSEAEIKKIADKYSCDFFSVENRGYGYGNDEGIKFCKNHYSFEYLAICNPDTVVNCNTFNYMDYIGERIVVAPQIRTKTGKQQNPYWIAENRVSEFLIYWGYRRKNRSLLLLGIGINKVMRVMSNFCFKALWWKSQKRIYAAHGSFFILSRNAIQSFENLYDEKMFLFSEEAYIAVLFRKSGIPILLTKKLQVLHKEDGSMEVAKIDEMSEQRKSYMYYYENYRKVSKEVSCM